MNKLDGFIKRDNEGNIIIKLNKVCDSGKIYYMNKIDENYKFLMDFNKTDEIKFKDPEPKNRTFYKILVENGELILAERIVPLKGFSNFRDLGGYTTKDNRKVKWGLFYRSEDLSDLKNEDLGYFKTLGIKYVLDYRSKEEKKQNPDVQVPLVKNLNISALSSLDNENFDMVSYIEEIIKGNKMTITPDKLLLEGYKSMPINNPAYKELFKLFKNPNNTAILQHCTAGKDRTGVGSALILLALNVPEETVIKDYLKSNESRAESNKKIMEVYGEYIKDDKTENLIKGILGVNKNFIEESLNTIKNNYSSYDEYFEKEYNLDKDTLENLRNIYLYEF